MFCSKTIYKKIGQIQKRGWRLIYNEPHRSLEELLTYKYSKNCKHINTVLTETYKTF